MYLFYLILWKYFQIQLLSCNALMIKIALKSFKYNFNM